MSRRILVVDDDLAMTQTLCDILRLRGWEPRSAHSGEAAIAAQREDPCPVVLMDIKMPGIDGVQAWRTMKAERPELRGVLMTAHTAPELLAEAERESDARVVIKPLDLAGLLELLERGG